MGGADIKVDICVVHFRSSATIAQQYFVMKWPIFYSAVRTDLAKGDVFSSPINHSLNLISCGKLLAQSQTCGHNRSWFLNSWIQVLGWILYMGT